MTGSRRYAWRRRAGGALIAVTAFVGLAGPRLAPHQTQTMFDDRTFAPPTRIRVVHDGALHVPFIHPLVIENRVARTYREDTGVRVPLRWFHDGRLLSTGDAAEPLLLLGADALGRDVFSRAVLGARLSLGVTALGIVGALIIGSIVGGLAGSAGGWTDTTLMGVADFLMALPGAYLVLVLRGALPLVLSTAQVFWLMAMLFALAAWPHAARGVRAIVQSERARDYALAARAAGAGPWRLARHLMPAARGFLATEIVLLIPALLVAEATVSYLGLGFADAQASWGRMLQDAANGSVLTDAPWMLTPAVGVFLVVLGAQLMGVARGRQGW